MKKELMIVLLIGIFIGIGLVSAANSCDLKAQIVNQDPYPAVPGDYVKVVFQLEGINNPQCGNVKFELNQDYPFSLNAGEQNPIFINSGSYILDYQNYATIPYKIRVDDRALDGDNLISAYISNGVGDVKLYQAFNLSVKDTKADFELGVSDYSYASKKLSLSILNTGKNDAEAFAIEIPAQDGVEVIGSNRVVIGTVASTQEEIASFEINISKSQNIKVNILYNDKNNVRRSLEKTFYFDSGLFKGTIPTSGGWSLMNTFISLVAILVIVFFAYRYWKRRNAKRSLRR